VDPHRLRNLEVGRLIFGLIVLGFGVYYFVQKTLGIPIPNLDWDQIWPLLVIALGAGIAFSAWFRADR
jgi:uncharacterized membrane protein